MDETIRSPALVLISTDAERRHLSHSGCPGKEPDDKIYPAADTKISPDNNIKIKNLLNLIKTAPKEY
jgi:hypothetical protein